MTYLFIGGNSDGEVLEVEEGRPAWHVADKPVRSLALGGENKPRGSCLYTKRTYRRGSWVVGRGSWVIVHYFALDSMSDREAHNRFLELQR